MRSALTFADAARQQVADRLDQPLYTFLRDGTQSSETDVRSYSDVDRGARAIAAFLQDRGAKGQRVLLLYPYGPEFIEAFLGCLYAGAVAVPAPIPTGPRHQLERVGGIIVAADVTVILTVSGAAGHIRGMLARAGLTLPCLATDGAAIAAADSWRHPDIGPSALAFLQYTSGSTSRPKGVMVTHGNLLHNEALIMKKFGAAQNTRTGGWLPFYHDMGLIGQLLGPMASGGSATLMSPTAFLRRPDRWLEMISLFGLQVSGGPNFCYDYCVRRVTDAQLADLDLSNWNVAYNGAEPVRADTMAAFADRFAPAGFRSSAFYPCYGMAETTLMVAGGGSHHPIVRTVSAETLEQGIVSEPEPAQRTQDIVSSGQVEDLDVSIVDPETHDRLPDGSVGEIWIRGASVAQGYWENAEATSEVFGAVTTDQQGGWMRSGDLGALVDGELFVTGRRKEMLVINGRNLCPTDIEAEARAAHPVLAGRTSAAFSVDAGREHIVVVQEFRPGNDGPADHAEVTTAIRQRVGQNLGLRAPSVVLVGQGGIRRTTSGKIQRGLMRRLFVDDELKPIYEQLEPEIVAYFRSDKEQEAAA